MNIYSLNGIPESTPKNPIVAINLPKMIITNSTAKS
jgi:hypothetical protein